MLQDREEADLVSRAQAGDQEALGALYRRHVDEIYRYAYRQVGNRQDAEDLTSEVFLQMVRSIGAYRPQASFQAWLYGIARNEAVDWWRRHYKAPALAREEYLNLLPAPNPGCQEEGRAAEVVQNLLKRLPEHHREVLNLRFLKGYSLQETAQALGLSLANVKVLQHRALKKAAEVGIEL